MSGVRVFQDDALGKVMEFEEDCLVSLPDMLDLLQQEFGYVPFEKLQIESPGKRQLRIFLYQPSNDYQTETDKNGAVKYLFCKALAIKFSDIINWIDSEFPLNEEAEIFLSASAEAEVVVSARTNKQGDRKAAYGG